MTSRSKAPPSTPGSLQPGTLFVPIVAERDGHEFIADAARAGAAATLTSRGSDPAAAAGIPAIEVVDTGLALMDLATWGARRSAPSSSGSPGASARRRRRTMQPPPSPSAAVSLPTSAATTTSRDCLSPCSAPPSDTEVLVLEMGMRGFGEIARLCTVAPPTIGIVTAVAAAHTARLGGIDGVARAKAELVEALPAAWGGDPQRRRRAGADDGVIDEGQHDHVRRIGGRRRRRRPRRARRAGPAFVSPAHPVGKRARHSSAPADGT